MNEKPRSVVTFTVSRPLVKKVDDGPHRASARAALTEFADFVIGPVEAVFHNIEGAKNNRSVWTVRVKASGNHGDLSGKERRAVVHTLVESIQAFARKTFGSGAKVTFKVEDPEQ